MKISKEIGLLLKDCEFLIISVIFSLISYIIGLIILFYNFKFEILTYTISICYILLMLSLITQIAYKKHINIKSALGKIPYYIYCFTLTILSLFIIQNLHFS